MVWRGGGMGSERFLETFSVVGFLAFEWDPGTDRIEWSVGAARFFRGSPPASGADLLSRVHREDRDRVVEARRKALERGTTWRVLFRLRQRRRWLAVEERGRADRSPDSGPLLCGVIRETGEQTARVQALLRSRRRLRAIFDYTDEGIVLVDDLGRIRDVNSAACALLGRRMSRLLGKPLGDFLSEALPGIGGGWRRPGEEEVERAGVTGIERPDGQEFWAEYRSVSDVLPRRHLVTLTDVTERMRFAASRAQLAAIVTSSANAIITKSLDGVVRTWNVGAVRLFGYRPEEMVGRSVRTIVPPDRYEEEQEILAKITKGGSIEDLETFRVSKDGRRVPVSLTVSPIRDEGGGVIGVSTVSQDRSRFRAAELAIKRSRDLLHAVMEAFPLGMAVTDARGIVQIWNSAAERIFGWRREEVLGKVVPGVPEERVAEFMRDLRLTLEGRHLEGLETVRTRRDGRRIHVALWSACLPGADEEPDRVVLIIADVTDRNAAEAALRESEERFRTLADNIAQFAWMADGDGNVFWFNRRWLEYTGTTLEASDGWRWTKFTHPDHRERVVAKLRKCFAGGDVWEDTFPLRGWDGAWRWFLSRAIPIRGRSGVVLRWFGTHTDITERMKMEEALREGDRRKDLFLATLAHELRNPLAPLENSLETLLIKGFEDGACRSIAESMERQVRLLVRLVDDLLDVSRITRGKVALRKRCVDLASVVALAEETVRPVLKERGHEVSIDLPRGKIPLLADPVRLSQVFSNLLSNAAHYTPRGGRIRLFAEVVTDRVRVTVSDSGEGIRPEMLDRIFDMFEQGDRDGEGSRHGLGIGLTLVKALVLQHGGKVRAKSAGHGCGSAFVVELPLDRVGEVALREEETERVEPSGERGRRVLVVDDNVDAAEGMSMLLMALGEDVQTAHDGLSALTLGETFRPDAVLLDLGMPGLDGCATARRIRQEEWGRDVLLVALTGWSQEEDRVRTAAAGFDVHLVKPTNSEEVLRVLARCCDRPESPLDSAREDV